MITLDGKRILVTGAAAGMGRAIAELAAGAGARVLATDRNAEALTTLDVDGVETATLDVTDKAAIEALFDVEPPFDGLVNTAGWVCHGTLTETGDEDWTRSFRINVDSIFYTIRAALPGMIGAGGGTIVNMASIASSLKGFHFRAAYAASKAAVIGLTKSVAVDYMDDGIRCHAVCPGTVRSPSLIQRIEAQQEEGAPEFNVNAIRQSHIALLRGLMERTTTGCSTVKSSRDSTRASARRASRR